MSYITEITVPTTSAKFQARLDADGITKCLGIDDLEFHDALGHTMAWEDTERVVCDPYDGEPIFKVITRRYRDGRRMKSMTFTLDGERL